MLADAMPGDHCVSPADHAQTVREAALMIALASVSNCCGQTVAHPFDLLKTRMQLQGAGAQLAVTDRKYQNVAQGLRLIFREDGARGFYNAWRISIVREVCYSGFRMGLYEPVKHALGETDRANTPLYLKLAAGVVCGTIGATLSNPLDVVNVRHRAVSGAAYDALPPPSVSFMRLVRDEGWKGISQGYSANACRAATVTAVQVASYDHIKQHLLRTTSLGESYTLHFVTSLSASLLAVIASSPVDVLRTRMMVGGASAARQSLAGVAAGIFKTEGPRAFYKGASLAWLRLGPHTITTFIVMENLRARAGVAPL
jgi:hypothetical protein